MWESDLRFDGGAQNEFGMSQRPQHTVICRPGSNPVGPRCAAAGRVMPWERPRPRPEGQFNNCETLREGIVAPPLRPNLSQVCTRGPASPLHLRSISAQRNGCVTAQNVEVTCLTPALLKNMLVKYLFVIKYVSKVLALLARHCLH